MKRQTMSMLNKFFLHNDYKSFIFFQRTQNNILMSLNNEEKIFKIYFNQAQK